MRNINIPGVAQPRTFIEIKIGKALKGNRKAEYLKRQTKINILSSIVRDKLSQGISRIVFKSIGRKR
jgi:hypothetical protein